jgi:Fic family protein
MGSFDREHTLDPVPGALVGRISKIDRAAGAESQYRDQMPQLLETLRHVALVESVTASSALEGVVVDERRVSALVSDLPVRFRNRSEAEFAGYRLALDYLHQPDVIHAESGDISIGLILHVHRLLYSAVDGRGGHFKSEDNVVIDRTRDGETSIRFTPVSALETPYLVEELVVRVRAALAVRRDHPLIVIAAFALDLLCIHPFADGNGRVARLLTGHLLERAGYGVGRYVSVDQLIFETKEDYYASLKASTDGWFDDSRHTLWPWATYLISRLDEAYDRFESKVAGRTVGTKQERIRDFVLLQAPTVFSIGDVRRAVPGVSDQTIRLVLTNLKKSGAIGNDGTGRSALWTRRSV